MRGDDSSLGVKRSKGGRRRRMSGSSSSRGSVERKVRELRSLVPGGEQIHADDDHHELLSLTADYIFQLRLQLHLLRALCDLYNLQA
ncbi:hypothetical protein J5N97_006589 [Dioscorea zingiberensis]|uniref:Uncharacterized protein n=1 Tax=Dioscorea zingiberensis TaxID=325984 RepID=A0A9D5HTQ1_9LILI|nr:hypothetical protein J5N97_006589 [Dioscorea zingiberensis]